MGVEDQQELQTLIGRMIDRLVETRSAGAAYSCWGYSFPWQTRTIVVPSGTPNLVCTTFVANALFDAYDYCGDSQSLDVALSAAEYILNGALLDRRQHRELQLSAAVGSQRGAQCEFSALPLCWAVQ